MKIFQGVLWCLSVKTRGVDRFRAKDYLKRAEECKNSMNRAFESGDWNACVDNGTYDGNLMNTVNYPGNNIYMTMNLPTSADD